MSFQINIQIAFNRKELDFLKICCEEYIKDFEDNEMLYTDHAERALYSACCAMLTKFMYKKHSKTQKYSRSFEYHYLYFLADLVQALQFGDGWSLAMQTDMVTKLDKLL